MFISFCHSESILQTFYIYIIETQRCCKGPLYSLEPNTHFWSRYGSYWLQSEQSLGISLAWIQQWFVHLLHTLPHYQAWKDSEKVRGLVGTKMGLRYHEVPTSHLMRPLDLQPLNTRLVVADWVSLHEQVSGDIDCSALLVKVNLRIPGPNRSTDSLVHNSNQLPTVWTWLEYKVGHFRGGWDGPFFDNLRTFNTKAFAHLSSYVNVLQPTIKFSHLNTQFVLLSSH